MMKLFFLVLILLGCLFTLLFFREWANNGDYSKKVFKYAIFATLSLGSALYCLP